MLCSRGRFAQLGLDALEKSTTALASGRPRGSSEAATLRFFNRPDKSLWEFLGRHCEGSWADNIFLVRWDYAKHRKYFRGYLIYVRPAMTPGYHPANPISTRDEVRPLNTGLLHTHELQISLHDIFERPFGISIPAAAHVEILVSNAQANPAFNQCLLCPHIAASVTVAMPLKKKNRPMRIRADRVKIGARAYM